MKEYYIRLIEIYKAYPKTTYYAGQSEDLLQDVNSILDAFIFNDKELAEKTAKDIEESYDYKARVFKIK